MLFLDSNIVLVISMRILNKRSAVLFDSRVYAHVTSWIILRCKSHFCNWWDPYSPPPSERNYITVFPLTKLICSSLSLKIVSTLAIIWITLPAASLFLMINRTIACQMYSSRTVTKTCEFSRTRAFHMHYRILINYSNWLNRLHFQLFFGYLRALDDLTQRQV